MDLLSKERKRFKNYRGPERGGEEKAVVPPRGVVTNVGRGMGGELGAKLETFRDDDDLPAPSAKEERRGDFTPGEDGEGGGRK